jgi:AcrR family transcriptional regulator
MPAAAGATRPRAREGTAERRRRILETATELFHEQGFLGTTVDEIAAGAGITKRTLYQHMSSKDQILLEIHEQFIAEGLSRWEAVVARPAAPMERLRQLVIEHVRIIGEYQPAIRVFFEEMKYLAPSERARIIERRDAYERILRDTLREGMQRGDFRQADLTMATLGVLGTLTEVYRWYRREGELTAEQLGEFIADQIAGGLVPRGRPVRPRAAAASGRRRAPAAPSPRTRGRSRLD